MKTFVTNKIFSYHAKVGLNIGAKRGIETVVSSPPAEGAASGWANIQPAAETMPTVKINNHKTRNLCDVGLAGLRPKLTCLTMLRVLLWKKGIAYFSKIESQH